MSKWQMLGSEFSTVLIFLEISQLADVFASCASFYTQIIYHDYLDFYVF